MSTSNIPEIKAPKELWKFLNYMEKAIRLGDHEAISFSAFVWAQRGDYILAGEETFEDQKLRQPTLGGIKINSDKQEE